MKVFISLLLCAVISVVFSGCNSESKDQIKNPVVINMPVDDTVNGYRVSSPKSSSAFEMPDTIKDSDTDIQTESDSTENKTDSYCGNKNSKVFHKISCSSVSKMKDENKVNYSDRSAFISQGYKPCGKCEP